MDPQLEEHLRNIEKKLDENTVMIRRMYRAQRRSSAMKIVYWVILIVLGIISISLIKPYLSQLGEAYGIGGDSTDTSTSSSSYSDLLNSIK